MESSIDKNVTYGIKNDGEKFRDVRNKATHEYMSRGNKKKKDSEVIVPKFLPGQEIVVVRDGYGRKSPKRYCLVEIIDFDGGREDFKYYAIILKTTSEDMLERVGRFITVDDNSWFGRMGWQYGKVQDINIHWLEEKKDKS